MSKIYETKEWKGFGKQNYYWNEYDLEDDTVTKSKCSRIKTFDSDGSYWAYDKKKVDSWSTDDSNMPEWLNKYL